METEINEKTFPIKKSYYLCLRLVNSLWLPVIIFMIASGVSFSMPTSAGFPTDIFGWIIVIILTLYIIYIFFYYWSDEVTFNIDRKTFSLKSKGFERTFPTSCITDIKVSTKFWHRTLFELIGNYYRLKVSVDPDKVSSQDRVIWKGGISNPTHSFNLSGLSKENALEIARIVHLLIQDH